MKPMILLVDDEPMVVEGLKRGLRREPYCLLWAYNATDAMDILAATEIDVIIADEKMPGINGSELLAHVRRRYPDTVRIMLTGHADTASAMNAIYDGWVYQYLHKPCDAKDLISAVHNGLLLRDLQRDEEGPHVVMSSAEQAELLARVAEAPPSNG